MNAVMSKLPALVDEELEASNALHPPFASQHEGYAVLLEEAEEASEKLETIRVSLHGLWDAVRHDGADLAVALSKTIESNAIQLAAEAIQVAAMARKFRGGQTIDSPTKTQSERRRRPAGVFSE